MKKAVKSLLLVALALLLVAGGALFYLGTQLDSLVAGLIEEQGSAATGTDVQVGGVSIKLKDASGEISRLTVANPQGFDRGSAIELGQFAIRIDPKSITSDTVILKDVTVSGARLHLLQQGRENNLRRLLDNLGAGAADDSAAASGDGPRIIIERFRLDDAKATVSVPDLDEVREVRIPTIELNGIGRASNGATAAAATRQILEPVLRQTLQTAAVQSVRDKAREKIDDAKDDAIKGVLDRLGGEDKDDDSGE